MPDPAHTLILIPCSNSKEPGSDASGVGASVLDSLPDELADRLVEARIANEPRADVDTTSMPAWRRYSRGLLYRSAAPALENALERWPHVLILSGAYGVVNAREPVANYSAPLNLSDWPGGLLQEVLAAYTETHNVSQVAAFVSRVGDYRSVLELTEWPDSVRSVRLHLARYPYDLDPRLTAPRIQGEALAGYLNGINLAGWRDSRGTGSVEFIDSGIVPEGRAALRRPRDTTPTPTPDGAFDAVLVKAATVRQHLRENLQLIDPGARGHRVTYSYKDRWIAPGVAERLRPGASVLIAVAGRPYSRLMPVRSALVASRDINQGALVTLDLELGPLLEPDTDRFSEAMAQLDAASRPGAAFVTPCPSGFEAREVDEDDHPRAWNRVVDHLQSDPSYRETIFLRLDDVTGHDGTGVAAGDVVGVRVECRAEHIPAAERADARIVADAQAWSVENGAPPPGRGIVTLERVAGSDDRPELAFTVGIRTRWAVSSLIDISLPVAAPTDEPAAREPIMPAPAGGPSVDDVRRLVQAMRRDGRPPSLALLEDHLLRWCPGDPKLEALRIGALLDENRGADAATALYALEPQVRQQVEPRLRFRAAMAGTNHADALAALEDMVEVTAGDVAMVADALGRMPSSEAATTIERVAEHLLGDQSFAALVSGVDPMRLDADDVLRIAQYVEQALTGDEAVAWLQRRLAHAYEPRLAEFAARIAAESPGRQQLGSWVTDLLMEDLTDQRAGGGRNPIARLDDLREDLDADTRRDAVLRLGEQINPLGPLMPHLDQVAREALTRGDFGTATSVVSLLHRESHGGATEELRVHLEDALSQLATVKGHLEIDYNARLARAAGKTQDRDLIIVGGPAEKSPVKDHLHAMFGFASTTWLPCTIGQRPPLDALSDLRSDRHTVVIVFGHIGHATSEPIRELCRKAGVRPCLAHSDGARTIERVLVEQHAPMER